VNARPQLQSVEAARLAGAGAVKPADRRGAIVAAHQIVKDCLLVLGWSDDEIAAEGIAALATRRGDRGRFRAVSWANPKLAHDRWYLAVVQLAEIGEVKPGDCLLLHGTGTKVPVMSPLPARYEDGMGFVARLRDQAVGTLDAAAKFLLETFPSRASRQMAGVSAFLCAALDATCDEDGLVETVGTIDAEGLLLQGWWRHPVSGKQRLLLMSDVLEEHEAICASFARSDLDAGGVGMLALIPRKGGVRAEIPRKIYLRSGHQLHRLTVLPHVARLRDDETPNHLRTLLPALLVDDGLKRVLNSAARPRFAGIDTVSTLDLPVRLSIDLAASVPGVGWYITGWMLDPANLATAVMLRGNDGLNERLDDRWTSVPRPDVNAGFGSEQLFQGLIHHDRHGFTAFIPHRGERGQTWIELQLAGERSAFMPVTAVAIESWDGRKRLLESVDPHKPSAREIIESHLAPLFHAATGVARPAIDHHVLRHAAASARAEASLIIPIVEPGLRTKLVVAELANRNPGPDVTPVFVCSPAIGDASSALLREIAFYDLDAEVVLAGAPVDYCEALEIGVRATRAPKLIFMSPTTHPLQEQWATPLLAAVGAAGEGAVASPTLLYEDWSVCYGGIDGVRFLEASPFVDTVAPRAGYPRDSIKATGLTQTLAASLACCAMTRKTFEQVEGFSAGYALAPARGLDLFLRLRKAGVAMRWAPEIEAYTLDDSNAHDAYWKRTGELVDGWSLRQSWKDQLPSMTGGGR
jgi:O-antigen biosynthesis protein